MELKEYMSELGKKGGKTTKEKYGKDYFAMIGKMGGKAAGKSKRLKKIRQPVDKNEEVANVSD